MKRAAAATVDEYIAGFAPDVRAKLEKVRATIKNAAPGAHEKMAYGIPTFALDGNLVHFAAFARHVGFYPGASGIASFAKKLAPYPSAKGSVRFALDGPVPYALIREIVKFRVTENLERGAGPKKSKPKKAPRTARGARRAT